MPPNFFNRSTSLRRDVVDTGTQVAASKEAIEAFQEFFEAEELSIVMSAFEKVCQLLEIQPGQFVDFYPRLKNALKEKVAFKYREIWKILDKKASQKPYQGSIADKQRVLVAGAGPCGLRTAIEVQLLGAKVIVIERREEFSRNNVLKLWKFLIDDLKSLGAKKFYGQFCAGNINHCGIRTLQLMLTKVALLLGIQIERNIQLLDLIEPDGEGRGWRAKTKPEVTNISDYEFDFLVIATGKQVPLEGFDRRSLDAKLSIAITANFVNNGTSAEAEVRQISGISKQYNLEFFKEMEQETGIKLENIVYYRGETHYFVMTALRQSLIDRGVILEDKDDRKALMAPNNINREKLHQYAIDAAQFSTGHFSTKLPTTEWALDGRGQPDCAIFDFTNLYSARNACRAKVKQGHQLLMAIVGDSLLEPFWPEGTGCARGFLSSMDAAWMFRQWAKGNMNPLDILAERENIYRQLTQTSDGASSNLKDNIKAYTIDPSTRYRTITTKIDHERILPLYESDAVDELDCVREPFVKRQYFAADKHKTLLQRLRKQIIKKTNKMALPAAVMRAARTFKRSTVGQQQPRPEEPPVQ